jgi:outer membrane lipoprotein SlyB
MKNDGLTNYDNVTVYAAIRTAGRRIATSLCCSALLLIGACATDSEAPTPPPQTQAERDLDASTAKLSEPLVEDTQQEGTLIGGLLGGAVAFGIGSRDDNVGIAVPVGMLAGSVAGRYVAAKQAEYSQQVAVIEAITRDVQNKNTEADRTIKAMEIVVAENRARLTQLRSAKNQSQKNEVRLKQQVAVAERDLATMKQAVGKAEEHLALFGEARGIIVSEKEPDSVAEKPALQSMDGEIETLRKRIQSMHKLVNELSSVS